LRIPGFGHGPSIRVLHPRPPSAYGDLPSAYAQSRTFQRACGREGLPFSAAGRAPSSGSGPDNFPAASTFHRRAPSSGLWTGIAGRGLRVGWLRGGERWGLRGGGGISGRLAAGSDGRTRWQNAMCGRLQSTHSRADGKESRRARVRRARVWRIWRGGWRPRVERNRGVLTRGWKGIAACSRAACSRAVDGGRGWKESRRARARMERNRGVLACGGFGAADGGRGWKESRRARARRETNRGVLAAGRTGMCGGDAAARTAA
jgi:hypothetical protein